MTDKNKYDPNSPEWQLFENMRGAEALERSYTADAEKATVRAKEAREKAERFRAALNVLDSASASS